MNRNSFLEVILFFTYLLAQVILFKQLVLFNVGLCLPYVAFILLIPIETGAFLLIFLGFVLGGILDVFYDSLGIHAAASVLMAALRNPWLSIITPRGGYNTGSRPTLITYGLGWFAAYSLPLILAHHIVIFVIEIGGSMLFGYTLLKTTVSLLFTLSFVLLFQYLTPRKKNA